MNLRADDHPVATPDCFTCQNRHRSEWCILSDGELDLFNKAKIVKNYDTGETIYYEGDPCVGIYDLESGVVAFRKYDLEGNATLISLAYPGRTLGYRSFLEGGNHVTSAEAVKPSRICFIESAVVRGLIDRNPALSERFLQRVVKDLGRATERYHQELTLSVRHRLLNLLLILNDRYGTTIENDKATIELPLSRQDLAALIGARPETLARTIQVLQKNNLAHFKGRHVSIPHLDVLLDELGLVT
jgi:CRP/FNR family transcriptional regulator